MNQSSVLRNQVTYLLLCIVDLLWGVSTGNIPSAYKYMQNVALTPYIESVKPMLLVFSLNFTEARSTRSKTSLRLDVYITSSLGLLTSKLISYSGVQSESVELCLPIGRFQLAFLAYTNAYSVSSWIELSEFQLTQTECAPPPNQTNDCKYLSAATISIFISKHECCST